MYKKWKLEKNNRITKTCGKIKRKMEREGYKYKYKRED